MKNLGVLKQEFLWVGCHFCCQPYSVREDRQTGHCINCAYTLQQTIIAVLLLLFMLSVTVEIGLLTCEIFTVS